MAVTDIPMIDNPAVKGREDRYETVRVNAAKVMESWRSSLFAFEWISPEGQLRDPADLPPREQERCRLAEEILQKGERLERPVLGIGLMNNIEIGAGRATFTTLVRHGGTTIEAHIPVSNRLDFKKYLAG